MGIEQLTLIRDSSSVQSNSLVQKMVTDNVLNPMVASEDSHQDTF